MELLQYDFMRKAFLVGLLLAVVIPCIGVIIVLKRLSMLGDALSHTSLAGVAAGLLMGWNPILGAVLTSVVAALGIEGIRKRLPHHAEVSIAVVMSAGVGLAGVLSGFLGSGVNFNSFLFGSIVAINSFELGLVIAIAAVVLVTFLLLYKELFYMAFDERSAALAGVPVKRVGVIFTVLTAVTVSIAARTVGALIVSSMMVLPVACALQLARSYRQTIGLSVLFGVVFTMGGLLASAAWDLRPGGAIVLSGVLGLLLVLLVKWTVVRACRRGEGV